VKLPCARHTDVLGGMEVCFHSFLTSALDVVTGQRHVPATLARYPLTRRLVKPNIQSERSGHICISAPARNWTKIPQMFSLQPTLHPLSSLDFLYPFQFIIYSHPTAHYQFTSLLCCSNSCTSLHFKTLKSQAKTLKIRPYMFRSPLKPSSRGSMAVLRYVTESDVDLHMIQ